MKKFLSVLLFVMVFTVFANAEQTRDFTVQSITQSEIEYFDNGYYLETVIEDCGTPNLGYTTFATTKYITKTKTSYFKNSNGVVLWSVSIKATFSYDGTTSKCTSYSHSTTAPAAAWSIKSASSSKSGNTATAKAVAVYSTPSGSTQSVSKSVTIKCSNTGVVS